MISCWLVYCNCVHLPFRLSFLLNKFTSSSGRFDKIKKKIGNDPKSFTGIAFSAMIHFHFHVFISLPTLDFIVNFLLFYFQSLLSLSLSLSFALYCSLGLRLYIHLELFVLHYSLCIIHHLVCSLWYFVYSSWIVLLALFIMHNSSVGLFTLVLSIFIFLPLSLFAFQAPGVPFPFPPRQPEWSPLMSIQPALIIIIILFFTFRFIMANIIWFQGGFDCSSLPAGLGGNGEFA